MSNVYLLRPDDLPTDTVKCLAALTAQARRGAVTGVAFVAYIEGHGFIANSAGDAYANPSLTRGMLNALDDKLALRIDGGRL